MVVGDIEHKAKYAQIFVGRESLLTNVYLMHNHKEFVNTLEDVICKHSAMDKLISDCGTNEISQRVQDILRAYGIIDWQSKPKHQHQNFAERHYQTVRRITNMILDQTGCPAPL